MRGITPVVATIILILMAIAASGMAFLTISSFQSQTSEASKTSLNQVSEPSQSLIKVESVSGGNLYLRSLGGLSKGVIIQVGNEPARVVGDMVSSLEVIPVNSSCTSGSQTIKITSGANVITQRVPCSELQSGSGGGSEPVCASSFYPESFLGEGQFGIGNGMMIASHFVTDAPKTLKRVDIRLNDVGFAGNLSMWVFDSESELESSNPLSREPDGAVIFSQPLSQPSWVSVPINKPVGTSIYIAYTFFNASADWNHGPPLYFVSNTTQDPNNHLYYCNFTDLSGIGMPDHSCSSGLMDITSANPLVPMFILQFGTSPCDQGGMCSSGSCSSLLYGSGSLSFDNYTYSDWETLALANLDSDSDREIVTGGYYAPDQDHQFDDLRVFNLTIHDALPYLLLEDNHTAGNGDYLRIYAGDIDADGYDEIVTPTQSISIYNKTGNSITLEQTLPPARSGSDWFNSIAVGNIGGAGTKQIAVAAPVREGGESGTNATLAIYDVLGSSNAVFLTNTTWVIPYADRPRVSDVVILDMDGDGYNETVVVSGDEDSPATEVYPELRVFNLTGGKLLQEANLTVRDASWQSLSRSIAGDIDGDGRSELISTYASITYDPGPPEAFEVGANQIRWYSERTVGGSQEVYLKGTYNVGVPGYLAENLDFGDIDGDGRSELLVTLASTVGAAGKLNVYEFRDNTLVLQSTTDLWNASFDIGRFPVAHADIDGDGKIEVVVSGKSVDNHAQLRVFKV